MASQQNQGRIIEVPIEICLPLQYPVEIPKIWVRPDILSLEARAKLGNLVIRKTESVDGNGVVWGLERFRNMRLFEFIMHLQNIFKTQLPIVSSVNNLNFTNVNINNSTLRSNYDPAASNISPTLSQTVNLSPYEPSTPKEILKAKVSDEIEAELRSCNEEMERLLKTISSLEEGESILNRERLTLNNEINLLNKEIGSLDSKRTEMERFISSKMEINAMTSGPKSATVPADPASSQLLELLSNEAALMDVLYSVIKVTITPSGGEKLNLTMALRCIRELSRKHFLTKAHIRKITEK